MERTRDDFQRLYETHYPYVEAYLRYLGVHRREVLQDILQESFIEAYKSWHTLSFEFAARSWLLTITRRQLARYIRSQKELPLEDSLWFFAAPTANPEQQLSEMRLCRLVLRRLNQIDEGPRRRALTGFFLEDKTFRELEQSLGIKLSTLTTWCSRFRKECQDELEKLEKACLSASNSVNLPTLDRSSHDPKHLA